MVSKILCVTCIRLFKDRFLLMTVLLMVARSLLALMKLPPQTVEMSRALTSQSVL